MSIQSLSNSPFTATTDKTTSLLTNVQSKVADLSARIYTPSKGISLRELNDRLEDISLSFDGLGYLYEREYPSDKIRQTEPKCQQIEESIDLLSKQIKKLADIQSDVRHLTMVRLSLGKIKDSDTLHLKIRKEAPKDRTEKELHKEDSEDHIEKVISAKTSSFFSRLFSCFSSQSE